MHALSRTEERQTIPTPEPTERAFTLTPNAPTRNSEVVEMARRIETRFREQEAPIVVRFERLLEKIFRMQREMEDTRAKNLEALGRKEAS